MAGTPLTAHARSRPAGTAQTRLLIVTLLGTALLGAVTVVPTRVDAAAPAAPRPAEVAAAADDPTVIAAISDFGYDHPNAAALGEMVDDWNPDYVVTTGDNVQTAALPGSGTDKYDFAVGRLFCEFMKGSAPGPRCPSGGTASSNRFFPAAGNHDHDDGPLSAYLAYFDLPGPGTTSRSTTGSDLYYDVVLGDLHHFVIDSDTLWLASLDGATNDQVAAADQMMSWLQTTMQASTAAWQVVALHEPAWGSSSDYGSRPYVQADYADWGADLVINGHAAVYERVLRDGINYVTNGLGGGAPTGFVEPQPAWSLVRINDPSIVASGVRLTVTPDRLKAEMETTTGAVRDTFELTKPEITTTSLPSGTQNSDYDRTLAATGGAEPYTWARTAGSLPTGLSLSSSGTISGKPTVTGTSNFTVRVTDADGATDTQALSLTINATAASGGLFTGLTPTRLLDTRRPGEAPCVSGAGGRQLTVAGISGVPANAAAVALNVTVTGSGAPGYLTVHPTGSPRPVASNLNYTVGQTVPNLVTTKVGTGGKITVFASGGCPHVLVDVAGYYSAGPTAAGGFDGITPNRVLDTRRAGEAPCVGGTRTITVAPSTGVPSDAAAVALNVTAVGASSQGYLTVYPAGTSRPTASNVNYLRGQTVPNHTTAKVGTGGKVTVFASGGCPDVVVDVAGYYRSGTAVPGGFVGITPTRHVDTRETGSCVNGTRTYTLAPSTNVPANAAAVALNVTAVGATAQGYLTVFPADAKRPTASNVNFLRGQTVPNAALVKVGTDGRIRVVASGGCPHVLVDVVGYHAG